MIKNSKYFQDRLTFYENKAEDGCKNNLGYERHDHDLGQARLVVVEGLQVWNRLNCIDDDGRDSGVSIDATPLSLTLAN